MANRKIYKPQPHESGNIELLVQEIDDEGKVIIGTNHREVIEPNGDISDLPTYAQKICTDWWEEWGQPPTQEEINAREAREQLKQDRQNAKQTLKDNPPTDPLERMKLLEFAMGIRDTIE